MARYYGMIGFVEVMEDDGFGVYDPKMIERPYYGDLIRNMKRDQAGAGVNDDITLQNDISIVADAYAYQNFHQIRYATFMGVRWEVQTVDVQRPRLNLSLGGVYNGPTTDVACETSDDSGDKESLLSASG